MTDDVPARSARSRERVVISLDVSTRALAVFDHLASQHGLSRPKMFARLMASERQRMQLEETSEQLRRDPTGYGDPEFTEWAAKTRAGNG